MQCAESLRLQAYFDSELDAASAHGVERHLDHCAECRDLLSDLKVLRDGLRRELPIERPPAELRSRVLAALDRTIDREASPARPRVRPTVWRLPAYWAGAFSGLGGAAAAAALAWFLILPIGSSVLVSELVNAHVHSLLPDHLIAVVSTDRHTVKPWFAGHADVSPSVADFEAQGYKLIGGRADTVQNQRAAVVVYRHGAHTINVFSWASDRPAVTDATTRNGYHLDFWKEGNLQYCAISDTGWDELQGLVRLLRELAQRENSPT
jgi:anti-sigma factor RsiW